MVTRDRLRGRSVCRQSPLVLAVSFGMAFLGAMPLSIADAGGLGDDKAAIVHVIKSTWETPERQIVIDPVIVEGDHGLAGWLQGERGGRALLRREKGAWSVILCSGDPLKEAANLMTAGVPASIASVLAAALDAEERKLSAEHRAALSKFEGLVDMRDHHAHHGQHK